jgi:AcrR family transcriptional regulator
MSAPTRKRSSADSRERLLKAAGDLFTERGYDHTTVREVGLRAGVDPAMIARYFGSKSALYLAWLSRDGQPANLDAIDLRDPSTVKALLDRLGAHGPTPTLFAAIRPHEDPELQAAAMDVLARRFLDAARDNSHTASTANPDLRAEVAVAALAGIVLSRISNAFDALSTAPTEEVAQLIAHMVTGLLEQ